MVQDILKPMSSHNYGTAAVEAGNLPVGIYNVAAEEPADVATITSIATSTSSVVALPAGQYTNVTFYNGATNTVYLAFAPTATTSNYTVEVTAGSTYQMPKPVYSGVVSAIWSTGSGNLQVTAY